MGGFTVGGEGTAYHLAEDKGLAYPIGVQRYVMHIAVLNGNQPNGNNIETSLFLNLLNRVRLYGLVDIDPAARERPGAVGFAHKQNLAVLKDGGTGIELRSLKTFLVAKDALYMLHRYARFVAHDLGRNLTHPFEAFDIKAVF